MRNDVPRALTLLLLLAAVPVLADSVPIPPAPTRWVTDNARWLTDAERAALDAKLEAYEVKTGHQLITWIGTTTGDSPTEAWTVKAFEAWKVGRRKEDDGVALFVFADDRKVRIEVGYGMEAFVPDATAARIIRDVITPRLKDGRRAEGLEAGASALMAVMAGHKLEAEPAPSPAPATTRATSSTPAPAPDEPLGIPLRLGALLLLLLLPGGIFQTLTLVLFQWSVAAGLVVLPAVAGLLCVLPSNVVEFVGMVAFGLEGLLLSGGGTTIGGGSSSGFSGGGGRSGGGGASGSW